MSKRKLDEVLADDFKDSRPKLEPALKNSLDSDEEDDEVAEDNYNVMHEDEFEGTEDEPSAAETNIGFTAFNMKEELEEGHFDKDGHYLWNKEKEIKDHWLDNIDWVQIKPGGVKDAKNKDTDEIKGLADSDSEDDADLMFDSTPIYKQMLEYMNPGETVTKALCRLGKNQTKLTTAQRWKKRKEVQGDAGTSENSEKITKLTELANELLTRTGNMDIYQETYEQIKRKVDLSSKQSHPSKQEAELDMYADDFDDKEKQKLGENVGEDVATTSSDAKGPVETGSESKNEQEEETVTWELKWSQNESAEIHGPHTTEQMHAWAQEGYFKKGAWVRQSGQQRQFYSASRVDFELYL